MDQYTPLNAEIFIAGCPQLQEYKCALCFELRLNMRKCGGPCQKNMCTFCLRQHSRKSRCPICKDIFQIEETSMPQIRILCPSLSQQCVAGKLTKEEFFVHATVCTFIPESQRTQFKYKSNYQCQCSGTLRIYDVERTCSQCNYEGTCSKCIRCRKKYCLQCRKPPIRKGFCARGHRFTKETVRENVTICDLCELAIFHHSIRTTYTDDQCDFDVCAICISNLPQDRPQPFQEQSSEDGDEQSSGYEDEDDSSQEQSQGDSDGEEGDEDSQSGDDEDSQEEQAREGEGEEDEWEDMDEDESHQSGEEEQPQQGEPQDEEVLEVGQDNP